MKNPDEDYGYEMERQRRIDAREEEDCRQLGIVREARFGGAMKHSDWMQKYAHQDPRPDLPFVEDMEGYDSFDRYIAWGCVAVAVGCLIIGWAWL